MIHLLLVADTHLGFDQVRRPRSDRPRRGADFFANLEEALQPAHSGEVDAVVHAGDLLYRSRVPAELVRRALEPLLAVADRGVPVILVPGNHERSALPYPLLGVHEHLHVLHRPDTVRLGVRGTEVAVVGFPCIRSRAAVRFAEQVAAADDGRPAGVRLLAIHQAIEGATVGPSDFVFRRGPDVVPGDAIPPGFAAVLAGHIHRHQLLTHDLAGRRLAAPVLYPGSIERTSFAEAGEAKGFMTVDLERGGDGGRVAAWRFHPLPTRPMVTIRISRRELAAGALAAHLAALPSRAVIRIVVDGPIPPAAAATLTAASLRRAAPPDAIVSLRVHQPRP